MKKRKRVDKIGATRGKLALIGVLSLVLVWVIVRAIPKSSQSPASPAKAEVARRGNTSTKSSKKTQIENQQANNELPPWPAVRLATTLANDPFARPSWAIQQAVISSKEDDNSSDLAELQKQGASIVVITEGQKSARIGEHRLFVGDILEGYQVTDITTQGVLLHKLKSR